MLAKVIGNSFTNPFIEPEQVYRPRAGSRTPDRAATDPSWMANTALWDSWFLSGIVDGSETNPASPMKDLRTSRSQFQDLAEGSGNLRNTRYRYFAYHSSDQAIEELFDGEDFEGAAINKLSAVI